MKKPTVIDVMRPVRQIFIKHPYAKWFTVEDKYAHKRLLRLTRGIYLMEEWWKSKDVSVCYHLTDYNQYYLEGLPLLARAVRDFHQLINPQQCINNKQLIFGLGATQLLHAAIYAFCITHVKNKNGLKKFLALPPLYFTHQTPGYLDTKEIIETLNEFNAKWVDFDKSKEVSPEDLVEIITCPNNPDSRLLTRKTAAKHWLNDRVNLWPFFITAKPEEFYKETLENDQVSIFSLPKIFSFSGTRVGYAFINDPKIAEYMKYFTTLETHGLSVDGELRCLTALRYLLDNNLTNEYVSWVTDQFIERWKIVHEVIPRTEMELLNHDGSGIWLKTPIDAKEFLYAKYKIIATYGPEYGASPNYARLNIQCTTPEFEEFLYRIKQ